MHVAHECAQESVGRQNVRAGLALRGPPHRGEILVAHELELTELKLL